MASAANPFSWEAEDVTDYITTLDEACILDIESYEEIDQIPDQHKWMARTYGPIYEPLLKPGEDIYARPKSLCMNFETHPELTNPSPNNIMINSGGPDEKYAKIMKTSSCDVLSQSSPLNQSQENVHCLEYRSTDNLLIKREEEFLYHNPAYNQSKCRTPLPVLSLNSSFYDESTSMNSSLYDTTSTLGASQACEEKTINFIKFNAINPLENSVVDLDGDKAMGEDQVSNMKEAAENGKFVLLLLFIWKYICYLSKPEIKFKQTTGSGQRWQSNQVIISLELWLSLSVSIAAATTTFTTNKMLNRSCSYEITKSKTNSRRDASALSK